MTYAEYVARERAAETRHEYLRGLVWAMAGGAPEHGRLAANVIAALCGALRGRPCAVFTSDVRVRVVETDRSTYPDVTVSWTLTEHGPGESVSLGSIGVTLPVDDVFRDPLAP